MVHLTYAGWLLVSQQINCRVHRKVSEELVKLTETGYTAFHGNGNLSRSSKRVWGHVFLKSEPDTSAKIGVGGFFNLSEKPQGLGL